LFNNFRNIFLFKKFLATPPLLLPYCPTHTAAAPQHPSASSLLLRNTQHLLQRALREGEVQHPIRSDHGLLIGACKQPATAQRDCSYSGGHERMLPSGTPRREIIATGLLLFLAVFCYSAFVNLPCDRCKRHHGPFR
jgi:hypothetical protein